MISYFDSSSIVKWFFDEPFADMAKYIKNESEMIFTSIISYPEVMSAFNRAGKEGQCSNSDMMFVKNEFMRIWPDFRWINMTDNLIKQAGELIFIHDLRAFDTIHLASAILIKEESDGIDLFCSCFDRRLNRAAQKEGIKVHHEFL